MYIHSLTFLQFHSKHRTFEYLKKKKKQLHDMFSSYLDPFSLLQAKYITPHTHTLCLKHTVLNSNAKPRTKNISEESREKAWMNGDITEVQDPGNAMRGGSEPHQEPQNEPIGSIPT